MTNRLLKSGKNISYSLDNNIQFVIVQLNKNSLTIKSRGIIEKCYFIAHKNVFV